MRILQALFLESESAKRLTRFDYKILLGGIRERETPDPIPNSEVKPFIANGTARKSVGE